MAPATMLGAGRRNNRTVRLLITGGSGFLGSHVAQAARSTHELFATYYAHPFADGIQLDVCDEGAVRERFAELQPDAVIHTAYDKASHSVIVEGSANIARAARDVGARLI